MGGQFNVTKGINTPKLASGMTAIKIANDGTITKLSNKEANEDNSWYDYIDTTLEPNTSKWANAQDENGNMFVWIPRYAYSITSGYHQSGAEINPVTPEEGVGTIDVKFLKGITNEAADGTATWDNVSGEGKWNIHPAFDFGGDIAGIWVGKFVTGYDGATAAVEAEVETPDNYKAIIKPDVFSWRKINISNVYNVCKNFGLQNNIGGDTHLMKNIEWGAMVYLAHSKYGRNGAKITQNNNDQYRTGYGGDSTLEFSTNNTGIANNQWAGQYGKFASSTGNVYGIYDIVGGTWEFVAAFCNNGHPHITDNRCQFI